MPLTDWREIRDVSGPCPRCEDEMGVHSVLRIKITKIEGTVAWFVVHLECTSGHEWVKGGEFKEIKNG